MRVPAGTTQIDVVWPNTWLINFTNRLPIGLQSIDIKFEVTGRSHPRRDVLRIHHHATTRTITFNDGAHRRVWGKGVGIALRINYWAVNFLWITFVKL